MIFERGEKMHECDDFYMDMLRRGIDKARLELHRKKEKIQILTYTGWVGIGKTTAVMNYCKKYSNCLYFSFANTEHSLALKLFSKKYPQVFSVPADWEMFFEQLYIWCHRKNCTVFFDSYVHKKDSDFYTKLIDRFYDSTHRPVFVFIENEYGKHLFTPLHIAEIKKAFPKITDEEVVMLRAVTGGISSLVSLYNPNLSFEINLKRFLQPNSYFCQLAEKIIKEYYRTPESYNTLLYGIATAKKRVSELSELSGYPNNKCDKYLKSLIKNGMVTHIAARGKRKAYYEITNEYLSFWYRYLFPKHDFHNEFVFNNMMKYIKNVLVKRVFRKECEYWLFNNIRAYQYISEEFYHEDGIFHRNAQLKNLSFDIVHENYGEYIFIKYFDTIGEHCTKQDWSEIERITTKFSRKQNNTYILFSIHRFSDYCWKISSKYDNVRLVQLTAFTPQYHDREQYRLPLDEI